MAAYDYYPTPAYTNVKYISGSFLEFFSNSGWPASATSFPINQTPGLNDVQKGWYVNGNGVVNGVVQGLSGQNTNYAAVLIDQATAIPGSTYTFSALPYRAPVTNVSTVGPAAFLSTNLNSRITSYDLLAERIFFQLGAPLINLELACTAAYDMIAYAIEVFTRFTPGTEELLIFDSNLYTGGKGIKLDTLINYTPELSGWDSTFQSGWDYDLNSYRKVIDIYNFQEGSNEGVNTLFTIEQSLAQQMHFAYSLGSKAFDLITWHVLKDWLKTREKLFAMKQYCRFDPRTQVLRITPDPTISSNNNARFFACVGVYLERPIKDLVKERWVMEYAKALMKISIANTRGKFGNTQLFGSGTLQYQELMRQGTEEKKALEDELKGGHSEVQEPPMFFLG